MKSVVFLFVLLLIQSDIFSQQPVIKLSEGFESTTFPPAGWKRYNVMGANIWQRLTAPLPAEIMQPPIQGSSVARMDYEATGGDDWLITKKINQISTGDSLIFYLIKQYSQGPYPPDSLLVKVSVTDSSMSSFTVTLININIAGIPIGNQVWHKYSLNLSQFSGQNIFIAFHHKDYSGHGVALDSVVVLNSNSIGISQISNNVPESVHLYQNYPNPFNPKTKINFALNKKCFASLKIFDAAGKEVTTLVNRFLSPGIFSVDFDSGNLCSGIYFCKLTTDNFFMVNKMALIK
jgi:hypothetical protein